MNINEYQKECLMSKERSGFKINWPKPYNGQAAHITLDSETNENKKEYREMNDLFYNLMFFSDLVRAVLTIGFGLVLAIGLLIWIAAVGLEWFR